jgi:fumarylacetoacetase-like protein
MNAYSYGRMVSPLQQPQHPAVPTTGRPKGIQREREGNTGEARRRKREIHGLAGVCFGSLMRLVTFDRGGQRRLGAILEGEVVDLPGAVGHPVFPATLEGLVSSSRGAIMDAARAALARDDVWDWRVPRPRILTPLFPRSLVWPGAADLERRLVGPEEPVPWPEGAAWLDYEPKVAAVLGLEGDAIAADEVDGHIFGYTLVNDWTARTADGDPVPTAEGVYMAIGPCIVTAEELDPQSMFLSVKIDGEEIAKGNLNGAARSLADLVASASRDAPLERGDAFALGPFPPAGDDPRRRLWPDALVELAAEGIGTLRNRVSVPASG